MIKDIEERRPGITNLATTTTTALTAAENKYLIMLSISLL